MKLIRRKWGGPAAHPDVMVGVLLLIFCAIAFGITTTFPEVPAVLAQNVPPTFFPRLVLGIISLLSLALIGSGLKQSREGKSQVKPSVFVTAGVITLSVALIQLLGMLLTLSLLLVILPLCWGERRIHLIGLLAVGVPFAIYLIFTLALGVQFPAGMILKLFFREGWTQQI